MFLDGRDEPRRLARRELFAHAIHEYADPGQLLLHSQLAVGRANSIRVRNGGCAQCLPERGHPYLQCPQVLGRDLRESLLEEIEHVVQAVVPGRCLAMLDQPRLGESAVSR